MSGGCVYGIKILGIVGYEKTSPILRWLKSADVDANGGRQAKIETTILPGNAMRFESMKDAWEFWRQQSKKIPIRPDGQPNRPLTVYSVEIGVLPGAKEEGP